MILSVVVCTYNPVIEIFKCVLEALHHQTMDVYKWELIVIDNNSNKPINAIVDLSWHPHNKIIRELIPGLSYARITGVKYSIADLIIFVDDDNILDNKYLEISYDFYKAHPYVGSFGGKSLPILETTPPEWFIKTGINLGCQDFGNDKYISDFASSGFKISAYPAKAPIGTGMIIQKRAFMMYVEELMIHPERLKLGRKGEALSSGEDNDIILTIIQKGFEIAYVPELIIKHIIPHKRYSFDYLKRMAFDSNRSWIKVLSLHGICPWTKVHKWTYQLRVLRAYILIRAWHSKLAYIKWKASCGMIKGLSEL